MSYTVNDILEYVKEEDVKFIRLAFCDSRGAVKNLSVMPAELERAFKNGISFDASAIRGFESVERSDMLLFPDPDTLTVLPWRPSHGRVVRLFCDIRYPDGRPYELDCRNVLKNAVEFAKERGVVCNIGTEFEFYLFKSDENGERTETPADEAGYMDVAPADKGENVRREICLTIEEMGLYPESSHHEEGPGQNEIDFKYAGALKAADHAVIFKNAAETVAYKNGFYASFAPKPVAGRSGNGMHINISLADSDEKKFSSFLAGVLNRISEITCFLNPTEESYARLGEYKAPKAVCWARENRSALIRIPAENGEGKRMELRSPDPSCNVYLAFALIIYAGTEGVIGGEVLPAEYEGNAFECGGNVKTLPENLYLAVKTAKEGEFVKKYLSEKIFRTFI